MAIASSYLICSECRERFRGVDSLRGGICEYCRDERIRLFDLRDEHAEYAVRHPDPDVMAMAVEAQRLRIEAEMGAAMLAGARGA